MQEQLICPYPGLRPFNEDESIFFKGRDEHIEQIVKQLESKKFLMLTGASGDGKSSLIYAGVIPNARAGFFKAKFNNWIVADFRPEREPLTNMATAISEQLKINDVPRIEKELSYGFSSLIDIYKSSPYWVDQQSETFTQLTLDEQKKAKRKGANLLILVDQFEEFFTNPENYHNGKCSIESQAVINSLLETTRLAIEQDVPIYIVCTMRSDYIGQCASFRGLPEYIGYSQFFVPRLKRKEIYQVIEEPAQLNGNKISKRLVEMLINEMNDGIDQLPVLQHSLNQIWQKADSGQVEMDIIHFAKINGIPKNQLTEKDRIEFDTWFETIPDFKKEFFTHSSLGDVLDAHANELFETANSFSETITDQDAKLIVETAFKCLTKIDEARAVRNRMTLEEVTQIINQPHITTSIVAQVLYVFRVQGNTFLKPFIFDVTEETKELTGNSVLDITHESLIRNWKKLTDWAKLEYDNLLTWQDFNKQLQRWAASNKSSGYLLPIGPLTFFENWFNAAKPNKYWLARYDDRELSKEQKLAEAELTLANAKQFIKRSARRLFINRTVIKYGADKIIAVLGALLLIGGCTYFYFDFRKKQNDYVIENIQEKSKELLKSSYIKSVTKADYILKSEMLKKNSYIELLNLLENDSVRNEVEREMFVKCLSYGKNEEQNEIDNPLLVPLYNRQMDYLNKKGIFNNIQRYTDNINGINFIVYSTILLKRDNYELSYKQINSKYGVFCENAYKGFINLLSDTSALSKIDINQFNKLLQIVPEFVDYDKVELSNIISLINPFKEKSASIFNLLYPKSESVKSNYNENITHNSGYFQLSNLYALCSDYSNLNRAYDSILKSNKNYLNSQGGYSYNRLLYSLMVSNSICSEEGVDFMNKIESNFSSNKVFSIQQLFIDRFLANQGKGVFSYGLKEMFDAQNGGYEFSTTLDRISHRQRIQFMDYFIAKNLANSKLGEDEKFYSTALLYKMKAKCYNLSRKIDNKQIDAALNNAFDYYSKVKTDFLNRENLIGGTSNSKTVKNSEVFKFPINFQLVDSWDTYNQWNSGYDRGYLMSFIYRNKNIFNKYYLDNEGIDILNRFMSKYANDVLDRVSYNRNVNLDFIEDFLKDKSIREKINKDYAYCVLTLMYHYKGEASKASEFSKNIEFGKLFSKEVLTGTNNWEYKVLLYRLTSYFAICHKDNANQLVVNKQNFYSYISVIPFDYLKRNCLVVSIDSLQLRKDETFAIELSDTLLNSYVKRTQKFANSYFKVLGRYATTNSNRIAMVLLKDKSDKVKPSCLNFFINGLLDSDRYFEATTFIPDYVSSSSQLILYSSFIKKEAKKKMKNYSGWGNLNDLDYSWADQILEDGEVGNVWYSSSEE